MNTTSSIWLTILVSAVVLLPSCKKKDDLIKPGQPVQAQPALPVDILVAKTQSLGTDLTLPGTILANETTNILPEVSGRIVELNIPEGKQVTKGALLVKLYDGDLQAQLRKLQVQLEIADKTEKRQAELLAIQGISQQEYDLSLLQVRNLNADMDIVKEAIRKTEIRAPFSGKLGLRNVSPGAIISPTTILTSISQTDQLKLQFNIPEKYGSQLKSGSVVHFKIDGSDKDFSAKIIATETMIEEITRSLAVRAQIQQRDAALIPGAFTNVQVSLGKDNQAIMVPNSAIIPVGRIKQMYVYENGKAAMREVETGVRDSSNIQIITGIKPGDSVITSAILYMRPGMDVSLNKNQ